MVTSIFLLKQRVFNMKREDELSGKIIGCTIEVHKTFGPGLLESTYRDALLFELEERKIPVKKEQHVPLIYKGMDLKSSYRMDLIVEDKVIIELKAVEGFNDIHFAQTLTYIKLTNCKLALLINFNVTHLKNGIRRVVNGL